MIAPIKPDPAASAKAPAVTPGAIAGLSAIENAINPARTGYVNVKTRTPTSLKYGKESPKISSDENAIKRPPATTKGSI